MYDCPCPSGPFGVAAPGEGIFPHTCLYFFGVSFRKTVCDCVNLILPTKTLASP